MQAILRVALNADTTPADLRDHTTAEKIDLTGKGATWEDAKAAAVARVPDGALKLHWRRG